MMKRLIRYLAESRRELTKITWPTRQQAIKMTGVVIVFSLIFGVFIGALDYLFAQGLERLILRIK